ncbi:MAG: long-chain fatty acid--CoA ligase [Salinarimonadaceae bacterium]|nr:MAG: long-chain fatty acid--CoA ligase [Salinarimonadaceae bacterium]
MTDREPPADDVADAGAQRPWLAHYPAGTPHEIDADAVGTLVSLFDDAVARFGPRSAFRSFGKSLTFAETGERAQSVAAFLQSRGLGRGDRVAIMAPNVMAYPAILFGILKAGCTVVNINPLYTPREFSAQIRDSGARALFVLENFAHTVETSGEAASLDPLVIVKPGDLLGLKGAVINLVSRHIKKAVPAFTLPQAIAFSKALAKPGSSGFKPVAIDREDIAFLQYTGGTTGAAKGATLLHRNVAANVAQLDGWMGRRIELRDDNVMITALPLYHIFSLTACCLFFHFGTTQVLIANPRDIPGFVKTLKGEKFTCTVGVNTLYNALANHPAIGEVDFSRLNLCVSGGMATQKGVAARWKELTGRPIIEGYGLSETSPVVSANPLDLDEFSGTIGFPLPSTDVSIRDPDGAPLPIGAEGELCVRGPQVMAGYWNRPEETALAMTADGFFRTGDMAVMLPDGQVRIVDRIKDMILVSGFNVYPNEIEDVLAMHPKVQEAAVIGVPDDHSGEAVAAFIVKKDQSLTAEEISEHCKANLAPYKRPRRIEFRESLPKTNVGKMLRRELRAEILGEAPAGG